MKYANINHNKRDRGTSIRAVLVILVLLTSFALPTLRPPVSQAQASGTVVGWGDNNFGQATPPAGLSGVTAIKAGAIYSLALKSDGTVVSWGDNSSGQATPPAGLGGVVAISAGGEHSLALVSAFDLDDLIALVNGLNIHQGIQNSLRAKLNAANAALAANDTATACTKLADFINECNAQSGKKLSVEQADELIARANEIRASLGCP